MIEILRNKNKFIGCKKKSRCYTLKAAIAIFKDDIKYYVVLKKCERFFVLFSMILGHWINVFSWRPLPGTKVLFKVIYRFYFINFMLYIFLCQSENLYELRHQILFVMSNIFKGIKFNRGVYKKNCNTKYLCLVMEL